MAPLLALGRWTRQLEFRNTALSQVQTVNRVATGFLVGIYTPMRLGPGAEFEIGVSYMHLESLERNGMFGAGIPAVHHFQISGGISFVP